MANVTIGLNDFIYLSIYQDDDTGVTEILPVRIHDNSYIGDPVIFDNAAELVHIIQGCMEGNFKVFENQWSFTYEEEANDN